MLLNFQHYFRLRIHHGYGKNLPKNSLKKNFGIPEIAHFKCNLTSKWNVFSFLLNPIDDSPDDLALIRDAQTIARPELVVVSRETKDWYEKEHEWFEEIKINTEIFRPKLGMYIASRDDVPGEILQKLAYQEAIENLSDQENTSNAKIRILNLGFDINRLKIIMNKLDTQEAGEILA